MNFTIRTDCEDDKNIFAPEELIWAVERLNYEPDTFLVVTPETPIDGIIYMHASRIDKKKGFFRKKVVDSYFLVKVQKKNEKGGLFQYEYETRSLEKVIVLFNEFFAQRPPDLSLWKEKFFS